MTTVVDQRIAERRQAVRADRRRRRLRRTVTVAVLLVLVAVAAVVERSSLVALSEIEIRGTDRLAPEEVLAAARLPLGTSTLRLDLGAAEARVAALPLVRQVDASRVDPLTVRITVEERVPVLVAVSGGRRVLVDGEGVVVASGRGEGLPAVVVPGRATLPRPGETVAELPSLAAGYRIQRHLPGHLARRVTRVDARAVDDVDVRLRLAPDHRVRVRFGAATRLDEKLRALEAVLADVDGVAVATVDVRAPSNPVVRS